LQVKSKPSTQAKSGLAHWMLEVPVLITRAADGLANKSVHDLRVALRRCRSMADGFRTVDPDKRWKKMRRLATSVFDSLGALRDCQVMAEWLETLGHSDDAITRELLERLRQQESELKQQAESTLKSFDAKQWQTWSRALPLRARRLPLGSETFQTLALEKLNAARRLQSPALRTLAAPAFHRLRIGLKKFRYVVENFLPEQHHEWKDDLKQLQDLLGEIHDLDVLCDAVLRLCATQPMDERKRWEKILESERKGRIERYCQRMSGSSSLWTVWRSALPRGEAARQASLKRLQAWSSYLDSDLQHSRRVARFAVWIYDGLSQLGVLKGTQRNDRELLRAAAVVHEVGRANGDKNHHKRTESMVGHLEHVAGWTLRDMEAMARIARYHRGALPQSMKLRDLPSAQRNRITLLAAILRLANALDDDHDGAIRRVAIYKSEGFVILRAEGLQAQSTLAEKIAAARHLLEVTCGLPILVRPLTRSWKRRER
jgi:CHAD domain-containing protein